MSSAIAWPCQRKAPRNGGNSPAITHHGLYFLLNDCAGNFTHSTAGLPVELAEYPCSSTDCSAMQAGVDYQMSGFNAVSDLDNDGVPDLVSGSYGADPLTGNYTLRFYRQAAGQFTEAGRMLAPAPVLCSGAGGCAWLSAADLDGDHRLDLVVLWECSGGNIELLHNDGGFQFSDITVQTLGGYVVSTPAPRTSVCTSSPISTAMATPICSSASSRPRRTTLPAARRTPSSP